MFTDPSAHDCMFFNSSLTTTSSCASDDVAIIRVLIRKDSRNDGELSPVGNLDSRSEVFPSLK